MSDTQQKFLDQKGVEYLWSKISMQDYPNNEVLATVINAIDETKEDKLEWYQVNAGTETYPMYGYAANIPTASNLIDFKRGSEITTTQSNGDVINVLGSFLASVARLASSNPSFIKTNIVKHFNNYFQILIENGIITLPLHFVYMEDASATPLDNNYYQIRYLFDSLTDYIYISHNGSYDGYNPSLMIQNGEITWDSFVYDTTLTKEGIAADAKAVGDAIAKIEVPVIDTALSIEGAAADAKAVGDALASKLEKTDIVQSDWDQKDTALMDYIKNKPFSYTPTNTYTIKTPEINTYYLLWDFGASEDEFFSSIYKSELSYTNIVKVPGRLLDNPVYEGAVQYSIAYIGFQSDDGFNGGRYICDSVNQFASISSKIDDVNYYIFYPSIKYYFILDTTTLNAEYQEVFTQCGIYVITNNNMPYTVSNAIFEIGSSTTLAQRFIPPSVARLSDIPKVDNTLSIPDAAADAKAVGDKFAELLATDVSIETLDFTTEINASEAYVSKIDNLCQIYINTSMNTITPVIPWNQSNVYVLPQRFWPKHNISIKGQCDGESGDWWRNWWWNISTEGVVAVYYRDDVGTGNLDWSTLADGHMLALSATYMAADGMSSIILEQVQSDWAETNQDSMTYIKNKPEIDTSLTVAGAIADAAATGEAIAAPKYVAQDTAPEDTNLLWIDTSDNSETTSPTITTGTWTPVCSALNSSVLSGDYVRVGNTVTAYFYIQGLPLETNSFDNPKTAQITITGLPYLPFDDGRAWYGGGGHLQRYYPYYTENGTQVSASFTGWCLASDGTIYARGVTTSGRAAYMLAIPQYEDGVLSEIPIYGAGSITYKIS